MAITFKVVDQSEIPGGSDFGGKYADVRRALLGLEVGQALMLEGFDNVDDMERFRSSVSTSGGGRMLRNTAAENGWRITSRKDVANQKLYFLKVPRA